MHFALAEARAAALHHHLVLVGDADLDELHRDLGWTRETTATALGALLDTARASVTALDGWVAVAPLIDEPKAAAA